MKQAAHTLRASTRGQGLYSITHEVDQWVATQKVTTGLLTVFIQHTSASLVIQENADPDVTRDLREFFSRVAKENESWYRHTAEGPDDMPAHIKAALTQTQLSIPVVRGRLGLGTWQGIYVFEHRAAPHQRSVLLHLLGE